VGAGKPAASPDSRTITALPADLVYPPQRRVPCFIPGPLRPSGGGAGRLVPGSESAAIWACSSPAAAVPNRRASSKFPRAGPAAGRILPPIQLPFGFPGGDYTYIRHGCQGLGSALIRAADARLKDRLLTGRETQRPRVRRLWGKPTPDSRAGGERRQGGDFSPDAICGEAQGLTWDNRRNDERGRLPNPVSKRPGALRPGHPTWTRRQQR
jgi:hypothetical protein